MNADRTGLASVSRALERLFPPQVVGRRCDPGDGALDALLPAEREQIARASAVRRREFAAGRVAARACLDALGVASGPLLTGTDRVPLWPDGVSGSISHARRYCVAVVARAGAVRGVGVDVEEMARVTPRVWRHVFTEQEVAALASRPASERDLAATIAFSAKESLFKCQYTVRRGWLGFHDVSVRLPEGDLAGAAATPGALALVVERDVAPGDGVAVSFTPGTRLDGTFTIDDGHVLTGVRL